jgi:transposase
MRSDPVQENVNTFTPIALSQPKPSSSNNMKKEQAQGAKKRQKRNQSSKTQHQINIHINPKAAGIDIGAEEIVVAIPRDCCAKNVRTFTTFTSGLHQIKDWLKEHNITTAAMESTSNYWINLYDLLEENNITPYLVNARHVKGVPGKKTDVCDAQWLQQLHAAGLLKKSYRPTQQILPIRYMMRFRDDLVKQSATAILHMHKILTEMNIQLHHVISDTDGVSGQAIIRAIIQGEKDPKVLAELRDRRCTKSSKDTVIEALRGNYRSEYIHVLKLLQQQYDQIREHLGELDAQIAQQLKALQTDAIQRPVAPLKLSGESPKKPKRQQMGKNALAYEHSEESRRLYGTDLLQIEGIGAGAISTLISEIGTREELLAAFARSESFTAWLGLCPCNEISGGKVLKRGTRKNQNRLAAALRLSAFGVQQSKSKMGEYCRRMKGRLGKAEGITATAHKLARIIHAMIKTCTDYNEEDAFKINPGNERKKLKTLAKLAEKNGFKLVPVLDTATS